MKNYGRNFFKISLLERTPEQHERILFTSGHYELYRKTDLH